tara:strand:- start:242 stop:616 length:375 start_codon:yes stop_codon:yes gene_type:complete
MNDIYESYNLLLEPFYDNNSAYYHILTINKQPKGPLGNYVKLMPIKNISTKINKANENYCSFVIKKSILGSNYNDNLQICTIDDITNIIDFLSNNNYIINESLTNILNKINLKKLLLNFKYKIN